MREDSAISSPAAEATKLSFRTTWWTLLWVNRSRATTSYPQVGFKALSLLCGTSLSSTSSCKAIATTLIRSLMRSITEVPMISLLIQASLGRSSLWIITSSQLTTLNNTSRPTRTILWHLSRASTQLTSPSRETRSTLWSHWSLQTSRTWLSWTWPPTSTQLSSYPMSAISFRTLRFSKSTVLKTSLISSQAIALSSSGSKHAWSKRSMLASRLKSQTPLKPQLDDLSLFLEHSSWSISFYLIKLATLSSS